ncbi:hypothetical protein PVAND_003123 [Polypedilum vanderplanki]|uniref:Homeobox protein cut-like n=1 Tax=Polypedilum vanderplanki TaxID=319348 RepID=A0A9J6BUS8_POLVA|nr:hypothetical protein PVAND_003123 [Polypedilum vanderplanki]
MNNLRGMQPHLPPASTDDMDSLPVQSMDWLFKKERIYLLAQFWQQRATLAEKEVNTLKEQLTATSNDKSEGNTATQNGTSPPSPSTTPLSLLSDNNDNNSTNKLLNNNIIKLDDDNMEKRLSDVNEMIEQNRNDEHDEDDDVKESANNNCGSSNRSTPTIEKEKQNDDDEDAVDNENGDKSGRCSVNSNNVNSTRTISDELARKDKEIAILIDEIARLRTAIQALQESHNVQIQRLEESLEGKRQHILRLENRISKGDFEDMKKENSNLRSVDLSTTTTDSKQFHELILEHTKALAAQNEKSSSVDGSTIVPSVNNNNNNNSNNNNKYNSFHDILTPIQQLKNISNKLNNNNISSNSNNNINSNNNNNKIETRPASTPSSQNNILPPPLQNVEQFSSMLGEEIVNNWRHSSFIDLPPPMPAISSSSSSSISTSTQSNQAIGPSSHLSKLTTSMHNRMINQFPNFTDCLSSHNQSLPHHHHLHHHEQTGGSGNNDKNSHDASSTASTPILQDIRSADENHMSGRGVSTPMSLPPLSKSPSDDNNHSLLHNGTGPLSIGGLHFNPFTDRGNNHYKFADDLHLPIGQMAGRLGDSLIPKGDPMEARLQEMLRYNMDKYANQNLDTLHISRRVRELLSVHNIGQRLFAKYVLGLSQGTVSELLSKPKPWDKLTEKGRDSYRKMHAWACDDQAVMLLKSLIPKKETGMPQFGRPESEGMTDERIQHILTEASSMIQKSSPQQNQPNSSLPQQLKNNSSNIEDTHSIEDSKSPPNCTSPFSKRMKKYENDDISEDKLQKIYQDEFQKLMARGQRDAFPGLLFPHFFSAASGMPPLADENLRLALEMYQREFSKLQQQSGAAGLPNFTNNLTNLLALQHHQALNGSPIQDLSIPKDAKISGNKSNGYSGSECDPKDLEESMRSAFSMVKPKPEPTSTPTTTASSAPSPVSNSILPPVTPTDDFSVAASPLQRMASITNSLITQSPVPSHVQSQQRPLKAVLPPITQQQFDLYNNLNTEDIVRRVKEALSQYSISQRLFGESVLGLSQGSVSDLLARPKPWHMLTQKGREPFIRMKMFLEDDNAVHKLVASQYKIAPDKLMRTGNYSSSPQIPAQLSKQMPPMPKLLSEQMAKLQDPALLHMQMSQMAHLSQAVAAQQQRELQQQRDAQQPMLLTPPGLPPQHAIQLPPKDQKPSNDKKMMPIHSPQQERDTPQPPNVTSASNVMRAMNQHISPTVYEMAALTQDLDTQVITTKIKEALLANNIGQKIFGEAVLGLSQGSVSELLSKPKPWHMLSIKGREPFIRMQLWLNDANNVERLQLLKNERREAIKRRRSTGAGGHDNSSDTSSNDTSEFYHSNSPGPASMQSQPSAPPNKKQRVLFSEEQKEALRLAFQLDPYPNVQTIEFLANELNLSTRTITNWFHNHRMRLKQQVPHGQPSEPIPSRENNNGAPFDPVQFRILLNQRIMEIQKERMGLSGMTLPYPPYFAANPNLAALIGRGLLSGSTDAEQLAALNNAVKEQIMGLDLSMTSLKRDDDDDYDGEQNSDNEGGNDDDNESLNDSKLNNNNEQNKDMSPPPQAISRTSRRKPAAPQWVNPLITMTTGEWRDEKKNIPGDDKEVIINGVCVMNQSSDYKSNDGDDANMDQSNEEGEDKLTIAEGENDEDESIKKSFIKKPNPIEKSMNESADDVTVKREVDDSNAWEY